MGIAGSTTTGDYVVMAGQVGVKDHVHIGTGAVLGAMAGVIGDVAEGEPAWSAFPPLPSTSRSSSRSPGQAARDGRKRSNTLQADRGKALSRRHGSDQEGSPGEGGVGGRRWTRNRRAVA